MKKQVSNGHEESKVAFVPSLSTIKLLTFEGKTSWQVYKTQFTMVAEANGWDPRIKDGFSPGSGRHPRDAYGGAKV